MAAGTFYRVEKQHANGYPVVEGTRCVSVHIPDDVSFLPVLASVVAQLSNTWSTVGTVEARRDWAAMWQRAYEATDWEGCMDCEGVEDCIETSEGVKEAIRRLVNEQLGFPPDFPYGENLPSSRKNQDLTSGYNPTCDKSVLFGQCYAVVDLINDSIVDVNQKLETAGNAIELAQNTVGTIPVLSGVVKVIGIDGALGLINYFQEIVSEGYDAQYTTTPGGTRDEIACAIFCECQADCIITIERVTQVLYDRLAVYQSPPSLEGFVNLVETLAGVNVDTTYVVDSAFYAAIGLMNTGNYIYGGKFTGNVLDMTLALAIDEPSNDWEILCPCSPVCRDVFDYANQFPSQSIFVGTLDSSGYFDSGIYNPGVPNTAWLIVDFVLPVVNMVTWRYIVDEPGLYDFGISWTAGSTVRLDVEAQLLPGGVYELPLPIDPALTDDVIQINIHRAVEGDTTPFKVLRCEVVYEC